MDCGKNHAKIETNKLISLWKAKRLEEICAKRKV